MSYLLISSGGLLALLSCVGFAGTMAKSRNAMCCHLISTLVVVGLVVAAVIACVMYTDDVKYVVHDHWNTTLKVRCRSLTLSVT